MKAATSLTLIICLVVSALPALAQQPIAGGPIAQSIAREAPMAAAQQGPHESHRMPKGFLWTGIGLLGYGAFLFVLGLGSGPDHLDCPGGDCSICSPECPKSQDTFFKGGTWFVAGGAAVLAIGAVIGAKRSSSLAPSITMNRRGFAVQQPVPLRLKPRRDPRTTESVTSVLPR